MLVYCRNRDTVIIQSLQNIQSIFSQLWKGLNMTSISVISLKKAIFEFQEDSAQFTTQHATVGMLEQHCPDMETEV
jgi:hypothetical protein